MKYFSFEYRAHTEIQLMHMNLFISDGDDDNVCTGLLSTETYAYVYEYVQLYLNDGVDSLMVLHVKLMTTQKYDGDFYRKKIVKLNWNSGIIRVLNEC